MRTQGLTSRPAGDGAGCRHEAGRIVYRIDASRVVALAVLDARRSLEDILLDRLLHVDEGDA